MGSILYSRRERAKMEKRQKGRRPRVRPKKKVRKEPF